MKQETAERVKRRSYKCPLCHKRRPSEIHHIMHCGHWDRALDEKYPDACLIYICHTCHQQIHFTDNAEEKQGTLDWQCKAQAQRDFAMFYPEDDWMKTFGRSYIDDDMDGQGSRGENE